MTRNPLPDATYLRECLDYDPESGLLTWKRRPRAHFFDSRIANSWNTRCAGTVAGHIRRDGYIYVYVDGKQYKSHRLIWKIQTGLEPDEEIDHRDCDATNNRWTNLRPATRRTNMANTRGWKRQTASGFKGVHAIRGKWQAAIGRGPKRRLLGKFATPEEAHRAYCNAAQEEYGEFWNPG